MDFIESCLVAQHMRGTVAQTQLGLPFKQKSKIPQRLRLG